MSSYLRFILFFLVFLLPTTSFGNKFCQDELGKVQDGLSAKILASSGSHHNPRYRQPRKIPLKIFFTILKHSCRGGVLTVRIDNQIVVKYGGVKRIGFVTARTPTVRSVKETGERFLSLGDLRVGHDSLRAMFNLKEFFRDPSNPYPVLMERAIGRLPLGRRGFRIMGEGRYYVHPIEASYAALTIRGFHIENLH